MTGRYLLWYTIVKDIDVKNNRVSDPVSYLYDRFTNEYCRVDLVNRDVVSATNIPAFQMRLSANYHVVPENYAIQYYPAEKLIELNGQGKLKGELKEIASKLNDEDNPVLLIAKFKKRFHMSSRMNSHGKIIITKIADYESNYIKKAGLLEGDEIIAINEIPIKMITIEENTKLNRRGQGKSYKIPVVIDRNEVQGD